MLVPLTVIRVDVEHAGRFFKYQCDTWWGDGCALHYLSLLEELTSEIVEPFIKVGNRELHLGNAEVPYAEAKQQCEEMDSELVEIWDAHEFEEVKKAELNLCYKFESNLARNKMKYVAAFSQNLRLKN